MKTISLTKGKVALVDDADYEWLSKWKWHASPRKTKSYERCYAMRSVRVSGQRMGIFMHRQILGLQQTKERSDHINSDGLDNQRNNLRRCTPTENLWNARKRSNCTSKFKGVFWDRWKWIAKVKIGKNQIRLGNFDSEVEAAIAYNNAAQKHYGEFALLNQI